MPNLKIHMKISRARTGKTFEKLHRWLDEAHTSLRYDHRIERHTYSGAYRRYIRNRFGEEGVVEWLIHLAVDSLETAMKVVRRSGRRGNAGMSIGFSKSGRAKETKFW